MGIMSLEAGGAMRTGLPRPSVPGQFGGHVLACPPRVPAAPVIPAKAVTSRGRLGMAATARATSPTIPAMVVGSVFTGYGGEDGAELPPYRYRVNTVAIP